MGVDLEGKEIKDDGRHKPDKLGKKRYIMVHEFKEDGIVPLWNVDPG